MDEYTGIFDSITPQDFILESTAVSETERANHGADAFNAFVDEQMRAVRTAFMASEGNLQPIALLANQTTQRAFTPDDEETVGEFIKRLNREAKHMGAMWTFYACKTLVQTEQVDPSELTDATDRDEVQAAIAAGTMAPGVLWYAERREGDEEHRRQGVMKEVGPGKLGPSEEASALQTLGALSLILGG